MVRRTLITALWVVPLAAVVLLVGWILVFPYLPWKVAYWSEMNQGDRIVSKIESFREQYARLPNPEKTEELLALGFELQVGYRPEYRIVGSNAYEIEYYIGFDGPRIIYSSITKQWRCELCS